MISVTKRERGWLVVAAVGLLILLLALPVFSRWDARVAAVLQAGPAWEISGAGALEVVGGAFVIGPAVLLATAFFLWKRRPWGAARVALLPLAGEAFMFIVKHLVGRQRPLNPHEAGLSFPSGHATNAAILACLLAWLAFRQPRGKAVVTLLLVLGAAWALVTAAARVAYGVHYFSDVVGGLGAGLFVAGSGLAVLSVAERHFSPAPTSP